MAKGTIGKQSIISKLATIYDNKFLGTIDNKTYVKVPDEGGEEVVIAIALTCPKTLPAGLLPEDSFPGIAVTRTEEPQPQPLGDYQLTADEEKTVSEMLASLGF